MKSGELELNRLNKVENNTLPEHLEQTIDELLDFSIQRQSINDHTRALEYAQKAEIQSKVSHRYEDFIKSILLQVGSLYKINKFRQGLEKINEGEKILNNLECNDALHEKIRKLIMLKGDVYAGLGELEKAISSYKQVQNQCDHKQ
ncbi:MAG: hypothetical protein ACXAD7_13635 [Candidatus Kariarchaeaceae archaeon]|jgi:tetratricopeptide (TPR) repeat protein